MPLSAAHWKTCKIFTEKQPETVKTTIRRRLRQIAYGIAASLFLAAAFQTWCAWQVYCYAQPSKEKITAPAALVLGAAAWGDKPSPVFRERINHALTLYQTGAVENLIFTGGTPKVGYASEAEVARRFAIKQGVDSDHIYFENTSKDTYQNLANARLIMRRHRISRVVIVSDPYHMARAAAMAKDLGIAAEYSPTPTSRYSAASTWARRKFFLQESHALFLYHILATAKKAKQQITSGINRFRQPETFSNP